MALSASILKGGGDQAGGDPDPASPLPFTNCHRNPLDSPHVHFPPTPGLASSRCTYSSSSYDRAPISIDPHSCELKLPERGERIYVLPDCPRSSSPTSSYFGPPAAFQQECDTGSVLASVIHPCPSLIPDLTSSESDAPLSPLLLPNDDAPARFLIRASSQEEFDRALLFLPHPPALMSISLKNKRRRAVSTDSASKRPKSRASTDRPVSSLPPVVVATSSCLDGF